MGCTQIDLPPSIEADNNNTPASSLSCGDMTVHFLDVGQGDSIFIELPQNRCMLIDAGNKANGDDIVSYIQSKGYATIDYLIATHPHADHIGGMQKVVETFDIRNIYMPRVSTDTQTFENLLLSIQNKHLKITSAQSGLIVLREDTLTASFISPVKDSYTDLNHYSAVLKLTHGENVFVFTGDAEKINEYDFPTNLSAKVVKVGHHGSNTSSGESFIKNTSPEYAIISVGEGNRYDHPSSATISAWEKIGATVFRTDKNGTIIVKSDGKTVTAIPQKD